MYLTWYGQSCFKIQGADTTVVTDPFDKTYGLKTARGPADIVTISHDHTDHNAAGLIKGTSDKGPFIIDRAGEYEVGSVFVFGLPTWHDDSEGSERGPNIVFRFEVEGVSIVHLGDLGHSLSNGALEKIEGADVLLIPVGGTYTLDAKAATKIISQVEPRLVIPMHYKVPGLKLNLGTVDTFCKELGVSSGERVKKLKITKKELPADEMKTVIMDVV
ncbi:MBL fold metallo-hydrolase [bacterium]|nr:MBL fold metallo-hydrolase [bacterium]